MKKIVATIMIAVLGGFSGLQAQNKEVDKTVKMDTIHVDYKTRYTAPFWSNFYIEADLPAVCSWGQTMPPCRLEIV